jgi:hypothetical protein
MQSHYYNTNVSWNTNRSDSKEKLDEVDNKPAMAEVELLAIQKWHRSPTSASQDDRSGLPYYKFNQGQSCLAPTNEVATETTKP